MNSSNPLQKEPAASRLRPGPPNPVTPVIGPACVCPLCGQPNQCAMEQRQDAAAPVPCWCTAVVFTPELLQRIPEAARGKACVCRACATQA